MQLELYGRIQIRHVLAQDPTVQQVFLSVGVMCLGVCRRPGEQVQVCARKICFARERMFSEVLLWIEILCFRGVCASMPGEGSLFSPTKPRDNVRQCPHGMATLDTTHDGASAVDG
jgi:hypothetical protein